MAFPARGGDTTVSTDGIGLDELALAARNHGLPMEALDWEVTPIGLHYLLTHYDIPAVDPTRWTMAIDGAVEVPLVVDLDDLGRLPPRTHTVTLECAGNGRARLDPRPISQPWLFHAVGTARWSGVSVADLLAEVRPRDDVVEVLFTGLDRGVEGGVLQDYQRSLPLDEALRPEVIVATAMNDAPLPPQHGAPARLIVPGWYGMTHVKWLRSISLLTEPFDGYQHRRSYRYRTQPDEPGRAVSRMLPRSLLRPPGIPEFLSRRRIVEAGEITLTGRAWSGHGPIVRVEVSPDRGTTWHDATVERAPDTHAWHPWHWTWRARRGLHTIVSRATDSTGRSQPDEPEWNVGGYEVNAIQAVDVEVI
ncbi:MAG TPA: sulfite oxidase [Acidimicrobiia bacterium]|nr:sulfite oxidase [Acidimicrobiia bacterium]